MRKRNYLSIGAIVFSLISTSAFATEAKSQLLGMAQKLAKAKNFSVFIDMKYDSAQPSGQSLEFSELRRVQVSRPNKFRIDTKKGDGELTGAIFDGSRITQYNLSDNVYAQVKRPGTIDDTIRYVVGELGVRVPLARLLVTTLAEELMALSGDNLEYVELNTLKTPPTYHIAGRTDDVDFQFWISQNKLPERVVITYKNEPGQPQFRATFSKWNLNSMIPASEFVFVPAKGAENIQVLLPGTKVVPTKEKGAKK